MTAKNTPSLATRIIHGAVDERTGQEVHGSPYPPVYTTTTFTFSSTKALLDVVEGRAPGHIYTRFGANPTIQALEATLADLEGAETALAFGSGMAALSALFLTHGRDGILCLGDVYGGTMELLADQLPMLGIQTHFLLSSQLDGLEDRLKQGIGLVFFETPANPTLECLDIALICAQAHRHGALVAVDNTFATPVNQRPLDHGVDIVMHSATKYLGGHSDLTGGALMGAKDRLGPVWNWRKNLGSVMAPEVAALLSRSLRTLVVRVTQQNATAQAIAEAMSAHPRVRRVCYPGLPDFKTHALARKQMSGFGGMLTLELEGDLSEVMRVADRLKLFLLAPSLGGVESLVSLPCTTSHHDMSPRERAQRGITDSMLRLSVGLEAADDLVADLVQALDPGASR